VDFAHSKNVDSFKHDIFMVKDLTIIISNIGHKFAIKMVHIKLAI